MAFTQSRLPLKRSSATIAFPVAQEAAAAMVLALADKTMDPTHYAAFMILNSARV